jgi:hypothetical protein
VNELKVKVLFMAILIFVLTGGGLVMAQADGQRISSSILVADGDHSGHNMDGMDMSGKDKNMDMSGSNSGDGMEGMDMSGSDSHSHEAMPGMEEKPLKETPANAKVLGTYGAVNAAFIMIGVWNKWFRRKDGFDGNTK